MYYNCIKIKKSTLFLFFILFFNGCSPQSYISEYSRSEVMMGTIVQIKIPVESKQFDDIAKFAEESFNKAKSLEKLLSIYNPNSETNALNFERTKKVSSELGDVLTEAIKISALTNGEFDITVSPLLKKYGFYSTMSLEIFSRIPDNVTGVGWKNIVISKDNNVSLTNKNTWIDTSGIAVGYIVDQMANVLRSHGIRKFLIDGGGEIYCENHSDDKPWRVGIRKPSSNGISCVLLLKNMAVSTSGDYENVLFDKESNSKISHIIDPIAMQAKKELPSSVTVIAKTCATADALSTGMMAMGLEKSIILSKSLDNIDVIAIDSLDGAEKIYMSSGVSKYMNSEENK